jgi:hypothetical protein
VPAAAGVPLLRRSSTSSTRRFQRHLRLFLGMDSPLSLGWLRRRSDRVIAISESAKTDIVQFLDVPAERIDVTCPGPALRADASVAEATLRRDLDDGPIVLTVSAKRRHKNLERLFEAFCAREGRPTSGAGRGGLQDVLWGSADRARRRAWLQREDLLHRLGRRLRTAWFSTL